VRHVTARLLWHEAIRRGSDGRAIAVAQQELPDPQLRDNSYATIAIARRPATTSPLMVRSGWHTDVTPSGVDG